MRYIDLLLLIASSSLGLFLVIFIARRRRAPGSQALSILMLGAAVWSVSYAFEIIASSLPTKLFWEKFEYFGIVTIPLAWFAFVAQYLGQPAWMKRILQHRFLLMVIPAVTLVLVWTNERHNLMWSLVELESGGSLAALALKHGPWFWVLMLYSYLLLTLASIELGSKLFRIVRLQRWQVILALLAMLMPWIGNLFYLLGIQPNHFLDWMAVIFLLSGVLFAVSLFRFQLVNIIPIAQEAVFTGLTDFVLVLDLNNCLVYINPATKNLDNFQGEQALGKNISESMPDLAAHIQQAGSSPEYQVEISRGEGADKQYYDLHISLLTEPSGVPIGRVIVLHSITQLKRIQTELEQARDQLEATVLERTEELRDAVGRLHHELLNRSLAEKRFEDMIELAPDAMFLLNKGGNILLSNAMAESLFGYSRQELTGKNLIEQLIPKQHRSSQRRYFNQFLDDPVKNRTSYGMDLFGSRKDGSIFPMEVDVSRLDSVNGYWMAINVRDISDRKRAEASLRESEQIYRALFENAWDAILLTDMEGRIIQGNQKATRLLKFSPQELRGLSILDLTVPEETDDVRQKMEQLVKGNRLAPHTRRYIQRGGEVLPTENIKVLVRDDEGKPRYFQDIARDISERIKAEQAQDNLLKEIKSSNEQMRSLALRLQEVQESERQRLALELHDRVGQNLTGLNLNLKILQNQLLPDSMLEAHKRLSTSLLMVEETTHKIRDVMAELDPPVLDKYGLMAAINWYCADFRNRTGIAVHINGTRLEPRLEPAVEKIVFRLLQESLNNIAKHAEARRVVVSVKSDKKAVSLVVKDNGKGFDKAKLGEQASQLHWGILSMQQRAASIGARLEIESRLGVGTQVSIQVGRNHHDN